MFNSLQLNHFNKICFVYVEKRQIKYNIYE